jgi:FkbM family methyltransferase
MSNIRRSKLLKLSSLYSNRLKPYIKDIRGSTRIAHILRRIAAKRVISDEEESLVLRIDNNSGRKICDFQDIEKYTSSEYRQSLEFLDLVESESIVYDVGAFHGYHSLLGSLGEKVFCFEPDPDNLEVLRDNVALNPEQDIEVVERPVWDSEEELELAVGEGGTSHVGEGDLKREALTLDGFVFDEGNDRPDVVKIDVEGAEFRVLKGAERVLEEYGPDLMIEIHSGERIRNMGGSKQEIESLLSDKGYRKKAEFGRGGEAHCFFVKDS